MPRGQTKQRTSRGAKFWAPAGMLAIATTTSAAHATPEDELAEALFVEAKALVAEGRYADACPKFAESNRLAPAGGALLALALCDEKLGRLATADIEFRAALSRAKRDRNEDRIVIAQERMAIIAPHIPRVTLSVAPEIAALPGLEVRRDGIVVQSAAWGPIPVDPGSHRVDVSAPGWKPWARDVDVPIDAGIVTIAIAKLEASPTPSGGEARRAPMPSHARRNTGLVTGAAGLVTLGVGVYFGLRAAGDNSESNRLCPSADRCADSSAIAFGNRAGNFADASTVLFSLGAACVVVGALLVVSTIAPSKSASSRAIGRAPPSALGIAW